MDIWNWMGIKNEPRRVLSQNCWGTQYKTLEHHLLETVLKITAELQEHGIPPIQNGIPKVSLNLSQDGLEHWFSTCVSRLLWTGWKSWKKNRLCWERWLWACLFLLVGKWEESKEPPVLSSNLVLLCDIAHLLRGTDNKVSYWAPTQILCLLTKFSDQATILVAGNKYGRQPPFVVANLLRGCLLSTSAFPPVPSLFLAGWTGDEHPCQPTQKGRDWAEGECSAHLLPLSQHSFSNVQSPPCQVGWQRASLLTHQAGKRPGCGRKLYSVAMSKAFFFHCPSSLLSAISEEAGQPVEELFAIREGEKGVGRPASFPSSLIPLVQACLFHYCSNSHAFPTAPPQISWFQGRKLFTLPPRPVPPFLHHRIGLTPITPVHSQVSTHGLAEHCLSTQCSLLCCRGIKERGNDHETFWMKIETELS